MKAPDDSRRRFVAIVNPGRLVTIRTRTPSHHSAKVGVGGTRTGGDPDLFVFRPSGERFFVEVKDEDDLKPKRIATFAKIRDILGCPVRIARVKTVAGARTGDGLLAQLVAG